MERTLCKLMLVSLIFIILDLKFPITDLDRKFPAQSELLGTSKHTLKQFVNTG